MFKRKSKSKEVAEVRETRKTLEELVAEYPEWRRLGFTNSIDEEMKKRFSPEEICAAYNEPTEVEIEGYFWLNKGRELEYELSELSNLHLRSETKMSCGFGYSFDLEFEYKVFFLKATVDSPCYQFFNIKQGNNPRNYRDIEEITEEQYLAMYQYSCPLISSMEDVSIIKQIGLATFTEKKYTENLISLNIYSEQFVNWLILNKGKRIWDKAIALGTQEMSQDMRILLLLGNEGR